MKRRTRAVGLAALSAVLLVPPNAAVARQSPPQDPRPPENRELTLGPSGAPAQALPAQPVPTQARPELVLQTGTTDPQMSLEFSPNGRLLASTGFMSHDVKLWEVASGRLLRQIELGERSFDAFSRARPLKFSADGSSVIITTGSAVRRWDVATGRELARVALPSPSPAFGVALSDGGRVVAGTTMDQSRDIRCWDTSTGRQIGVVPADSTDITFAPESITLSPRGDLIAAFGSGLRVAQSYGAPARTNGVSIWDATGRPLRELAEPSPSSPFGAPEPDVEPLGVAFSPDGARIAARDGEEITVWSVADGRVVATSRPGGGTVDRAAAIFAFGVGRVVFSADGRLLAAPGGDGVVRLVDASSGATVRTLEGHEGAVVATAFSGGGLVASSGVDGVIKLWDVSSGAELRALRGTSAAPTAVAFSADRRSLVVGSREAASVWDAGSGDFRRTVTLPDDFVQTPWTGDPSSHQCLSADGRFFAAGSSREPLVKVWDVTTGAEAQRVALAPGKELATAAFSADGQSLALVDRNNAQARAASVRPRPQPQGGQSGVQTLDQAKLAEEIRKDPKKAFKEMRRIAEAMSKAPQPSDPGAKLDSMDEAGLLPEGSRRIDPGFGLRVSAVGAGGQAKELPAPSVGNIPFTQHSDLSGVYSMTAVSPDGKFVAVCPVSGAPLAVVDVAAGRQAFALAPPQYGGFYGVVWSPDAARVATFELSAVPGPGGGSYRLEFVIRLWDARTGAQVASFADAKDLIAALAFSPDGRVLASAAAGGELTLWDIASGRELRRLEGHSGPVGALAFSPGGKFLVSGGADGGARLWDPATGELLATLVCFHGTADWLVVTPDGLFDGSPGGWQQILWRFSGDTFKVAPVEAFFFEFFSPGLLGELLEGKRPRAAVDVAKKRREQPKVEIALASGPASAPVSTRLARVRVSVSEAAAGAQDVRLFRNGSLVKVWRGDVLKGQPSATLEADVTLVAGENRLTAYAFNGDNVKSVDAALTVTGADSLERAGTLHVLAVGVDEYANPEFNLRYATPDANDFAEEVERQQKKVGAYPTVEVTRLLDRDATKANVLLALGRLAGDVKELPPDAPAAVRAMTPAEPEDAVVVFFAGHGTAQGDRFYLLPHDLGYAGPRAALDAAGLRDVLAHAISDLELERAVEDVDAGHALLVIDACHSGQALEAEEKRRGPMNSKGLAQLAYEKGMYVLTAAQSYQAALEATELGHGLLTYALVEEGLKTPSADGGPRDGSVELREWLDFATNRVPGLEESTLRRKRDLALASSAEDKAKDEAAERAPQRPRVFYRREPDARPLVVARP